MKCPICWTVLKRKSLNKHIETKLHKKIEAKFYKKKKSNQKTNLIKNGPKPKQQKLLKKEIKDLVNNKGQKEMLLEIVRKRRIQPTIRDVGPVYDDDK